MAACGVMIVMSGFAFPCGRAFCENCKHRAWENMLYINNIVRY